MRKIILTAALYIFSCNVFAEWVEFSKYQHGTVYVDNATIRRADDRVKFWVKTLGPSAGLRDETIMQREVDCKQELHRVHSYTSTVPHSSDNQITKWMPIRPDGDIRDLFVWACKQDKKWYQQLF